MNPKSCRSLGLFLMTLTMVAFAQSGSSVAPYSKHQRPVHVQQTDRQNYMIVDETIWDHSQAMLSDLRLFSAAGREVPYVLRIQRAERYSTEASVKLLNKGAVKGDTQFTLDVSVDEYDHVHLNILTENYVAKAKVEGANDVKGERWNDLGTYSLYDFSKERLGGNSSIQLNDPSRYRYLRVTIAGPVPPDDVTGAGVANYQESKAKYLAINTKLFLLSIFELGKKTVVEWTMPDKVPVERIQFNVDAGEINFRRQFALSCDGRSSDRGELTRVKLTRKDRKIEYEDLAMENMALHCKKYRIEIENGDDPALRISAVNPMMLERRIYFDPRQDSGFNLYYGDEKLGAPIYDFAKFFEPSEESKLARAELMAEAANPGFTERPDERPFTEKNPAVLWVAMILAVGLLGAWAMKGFKN